MNADNNLTARLGLLACFLVGFLTRGETEAGSLFHLPLKQEITHALTAEEAKTLTIKIRNAVEDVWDLLQIAHEQKAWEPLGYVSWSAYVIAEFKMSKQRSYQLLDYQSVCKSLSDSKASQAGLTLNAADNKETLTKPPPEKVVRPLVKVPDEKRAEVLSAAVEASPKGKPTAKAVVAAVDTFLGKPPKPIISKLNGEHDEDNAKEVALEMKALEDENRQLERLNKSLTATDAGKQIAAITHDFQAACGRVNQLLTETNEMRSTIKYQNGLLAKCRKLLQCENPGIVSAIMKLLEASRGSF